MNKEYGQELKVHSVGYSALLCISFGLLLLLGSLFLAEARPTAFFASGLVGATAIVLMYRRIASQWRPDTAPDRGIRGAMIGSLSNMPFLLTAIFLAGTGYIGAKAAGTAWATPFIPYVLFVFLFPWCRIALCRTKLATSLTMLCAGLIAGLVTTDPLPKPFVLAIAAWILWLTAVLGWLRLILIDRQQLRAKRAAGGHAADQQGNELEVLHNTPVN